MKYKTQPLMSLHIGDDDDHVKVLAIIVDDVKMPVPILNGCFLYPGESLLIENVAGTLKVIASREDPE